MAIYVGEGLSIVCAATDPLTNGQINTVTAVVDFFAPGKQPKTVPADRAVVDEGPFTMNFDTTVINKDGTTGAYVALIDTTGWPAGVWAYRVTLTGGFVAFDFATVKLSA